MAFANEKLSPDLIELTMKIAHDGDHALAKAIIVARFCHMLKGDEDQAPEKHFAKVVQKSIKVDISPPHFFGAAPNFFSSLTQEVVNCVGYQIFFGRVVMG